MTADERAEIAGTLGGLQKTLEGLMVRGLRSAGADEVKQLQVFDDELHRVGASYLGGRVRELKEKLRAGDVSAARSLFGVQASLRVFDRVVTLHAACESLGGDAVEAAEGAPVAVAKRGEDRSAQLPMLEELAATVESLVSTGLTTASAATRQKLEVSFKEASRLKLLRLGASLRYVNEELGRFLKDASTFSPKRFAFFLSRSWLLARGLHEAISEDDQKWLARLLMTREPQPVKSLDFVVLGVAKRVANDGAAGFDFRLRSVPDGKPLVWSCLFPARKGVPAEAFLHLPQPQKFTPKTLLEGATYTVTDCALAPAEGAGPWRVMLGPKTTLARSKEVFRDWAPFLETDWVGIQERAAMHQVTPLELEVELQEEVVLPEWSVGEPVEREDAKLVFPLLAGGREMTVVVSKSAGDAELLAMLREAAKPKKKTSGALFGLMHYESLQLVLQPLSVVEGESVRQVMLSDEKFSVAALVGTLQF